MIKDDKIVIYGQSCSGKTTFAKKYFPEHHYYCFDSLFPWQEIEILCLPISKYLENIQKTCDKKRFVLDGWHPSDIEGKYLPENSTIYVLWCSYDKMISQYRGNIISYDSMRYMYKKWYCMFDFGRFKNVKFFENDHDFNEITYDHFITLSKCNQ